MTERKIRVSKKKLKENFYCYDNVRCGERERERGHNNIQNHYKGLKYLHYTESLIVGGSLQYISVIKHLEKALKRSSQ